MNKFKLVNEIHKKYFFALLHAKDTSLSNPDFFPYMNLHITNLISYNANYTSRYYLGSNNLSNDINVNLCHYYNEHHYSNGVSIQLEYDSEDSKEYSNNIKIIYLADTVEVFFGHRIQNSFEREYFSIENCTIENEVIFDKDKIMLMTFENKMPNIYGYELLLGDNNECNKIKADNI